MEIKKTIYGNKNKFNILDLQCPKKSKKTEGLFQSQNRKVKNKPYKTKQKERRKEGRKKNPGPKSKH
jgi:hypothetical protein